MKLDLKSHSGWGIFWEICFIYVIDSREIVHVVHVDSCPDNIAQSSPCNLQNLLQVCEDLPGLVLHGVEQVPGAEDDPDLAGDVEGVVHPHRLVVGTQGGGGLGRFVDHSSVARGLEVHRGSATTVVYINGLLNVTLIFILNNNNNLHFLNSPKVFFYPTCCNRARTALFRKTEPYQRLSTYQFVLNPNIHYTNITFISIQNTIYF